MTKNKTKAWLIIATSLVLLGLIIFGGVMTVLKWDFRKLSTVKYETNTHQIDEAYQDISIVTKTANIVFVPSDGEKTVVTCYEQKKVRHSVQVRDGKLTIEVVDTRAWYEYISISFDSPTITVAIPKEEYGALQIETGTGDVHIPKELRFESIDISESTGDVTCHADASGDVKIRTSTGNIHLEGLSAGSMELSVSTGRVTLIDVKCRSIRSNSGTGSMYLKNVVAAGQLSFESGTGDVHLKNVVSAGKLSVHVGTGNVNLEASDAAEILVRTSTGNVTGTLLSAKVFEASTGTGSVDVPKTQSGGRCEISTGTGNIKITIL